MCLPSLERLCLKLLLCSVVITSSIPSRASSLPVVEDFDDGVADGFSMAGVSTVYTVTSNSGGQGYQASLSAPTGNVTGSTGIALDDVATAFVVSTRVTVSSFTAPSTSGVNVGLGLFSNTVNFSEGGQYRLIYQLAQGNAGKLQIIRNGTSIALSTAIIPPRLNVSYTLQAIVTHANGEVTIKGLLSDDANTISVTITDPAPLPGRYFGYRTAVNAVGGIASLIATYDDFTLITPSFTEGEHNIMGNLSVGGNVDATGGAVTYGSFGETYGAGVAYDDFNHRSVFEVSSAEGSWQWQRGATTAMFLDNANRLILPHPSGDEGAMGIVLDPTDGSTFGGSLLLLGSDNRAPNQGITDDHSLLTVALGDGRYLRPDVPSLPSLTVIGDAHFGGTVDIAPQGDLSMGEFTESSP